MKRVTLIIVAIVSLIKIRSQEKADFIIYNGKIATMNVAAEFKESVAVKDGKILDVDNTKRILAIYKGATTRMIDAGGKTVIPGLFDSHLHVIRGGRFYNTELRWDGVKTLKRAMEMLKEQARRTPEGQWVRVVGGWNEYQFEEKRLPTLDEINEAAGEVPVFILYLYGKAWLNKAGLKKLNIDANTPNPVSGLIEKDAQGDPTGLLVAEPNAFILYSTLSKLPELSEEEKINSTLQYMTELNSLGVTAVMDAGGGFQNFPDDYGITDSLNRAGKITVRLPYYLFAQKKGSELNDYTRWAGLVEIDHHKKDGIDYYVQGGGENLVADAADFENFLFPRPELPAGMETSLKSVLKLLVKNRWPFRIHATYNESIGRDLDVIEQVNQETPLNGLIWFFDHAETISERNMQRIKRLGGGIAIQHRMAYQGESFIRRYGKAAALSAPPVKRMIEIGLPVAMGTDGTRVASYNPWIALYWITTGKSIGGNEVIGKEQLLDRITALRLFGSGGYNLIKQDNSKGKIQRGFVADLVILNHDYFSVAEEQIPGITALLTILDGKIVYGKSEYQSISPLPLPVIPTWSPVKHFGGYQYK